MGSPECSVSLKPLYPWSSLAFGDMAESVDLRADVVGHEQRAVVPRQERFYYR